MRRTLGMDFNPMPFAATYEVTLVAVGRLPSLTALRVCCQFQDGALDALTDCRQLRSLELQQLYLPYGVQPLCHTNFRSLRALILSGCQVNHGETSEQNWQPILANLRNLRSLHLLRAHGWLSRLLMEALAAQPCPALRKVHVNRNESYIQYGFKRFGMASDSLRAVWAMQPQLRSLSLERCSFPRPATDASGQDQA